MVRTGLGQFASGENGHLCSSQQQPPREVPPAGRQEAAGVPGGSSDAGSETLAEQGLRAGRTPLCSRLTGLPSLPRSSVVALLPGVVVRQPRPSVSHSCCMVCECDERTLAPAVVTKIRSHHQAKANMSRVDLSCDIRVS